MSKHLTAQQKAELEAVLRRRQRELSAADTSHLDGRTRFEHAREVLLQDGDDAPQRDADREVDLATSDHEVVELAAIAEALKRLAAGYYGLCIECGAEIPFARLQLEPQSPYCTACAAARERGQPRPPTM